MQLLGTISNKKADKEGGNELKFASFQGHYPQKDYIRRPFF
jgi:hypothetical protein